MISTNLFNPIAKLHAHVHSSHCNQHTKVFLHVLENKGWAIQNPFKEHLLRVKQHAETRQILIEKREGKREETTDDINSSFAIAEPSSWTVGEVNPIWQVISSGQRLELVVVPIVHKRIPKDEVARNLRLPSSTKTEIQNQQYETNYPQFPHLFKN